MNSSDIGRSQSNIYLDDPDFYHQNQNIHHLSPQYSVSTMNMPSMIASSTFAPLLSSSSSILKGATSMQQLKGSTIKLNSRPSNITEQQNMIMDQDKSTLSIPDIYEQELMNERRMCIQQMVTSGQNLASMFNDDPHFAQQITAYMSSGNYYRQQQESEVIEIMDE